MVSEVVTSMWRHSTDTINIHHQHIIIMQDTQPHCYGVFYIISVMVSEITGVSSVCSTVCSGADQRKHQISASLVFVRGIPSQSTSTEKCFHLMTSSCNFSVAWLNHSGRNSSTTLFLMAWFLYSPDRQLSWYLLFMWNGSLASMREVVTVKPVCNDHLYN